MRERASVRTRARVCVCVCVCVCVYVCVFSFVCMVPGVRGSSRASMVCLCVAKLLFSTALMGCLEPGVRGSSQALMACLCGWTNCVFRGFDVLPEAWRA